MTNELGERLSERLLHPTPYDLGRRLGEHGTLVELARLRERLERCEGKRK